jgi:hypothetical protein
MAHFRGGAVTDTSLDTPYTTIGATNCAAVSIHAMRHGLPPEVS